MKQICGTTQMTMKEDYIKSVCAAQPPPEKNDQRIL